MSVNGDTHANARTSEHHKWVEWWGSSLYQVGRLSLSLPRIFRLFCVWTTVISLFFLFHYLGTSPFSHTLKCHIIPRMLQYWPYFAYFIAIATVAISALLYKYQCALLYPAFFPPGSRSLVPCRIPSCCSCPTPPLIPKSNDPNDY